jgi:transcriptional regulator with XRE-family HTH domain
MKDRILQFLKEENKTSAQFAEEIGVQPSGISHITSGRNNPSLDFIIKMLEKYNYLSTDWLLFGKGEMYRIKKTPTLFDDYDFSNQTKKQPDNHADNAEKMASQIITETTLQKNYNQKSVSKIVWFYDDNTFEEFSRGE